MKGKRERGNGQSKNEIKKKRRGLVKMMKLRSRREKRKAKNEKNSK